MDRVIKLLNTPKLYIYLSIPMMIIIFLLKLSIYYYIIPILLLIPGLIIKNNKNKNKID